MDNTLPCLTLMTYDNRMITLPGHVAIHCKYLRENFLDDKFARKDGQTGAIPLTSNSNCVSSALQYAVSYLKLCDAMSSLPGSGYSMEDNGVSLVSVHLPSIYTYLGRGTTRLPWEQALGSYASAIDMLSDSLLVQLLHTAEFLELRGMRDTVVRQIAARIEKCSEDDTILLARSGSETLINALIALCSDYMTADEELALQFVRALAVLVTLGFAQDMRSFQILTMPEVACCYPLEKETSRALLLVTSRLGPENVLKHYIWLWDNLDAAVRRFGLHTFFSIEMALWTPKCVEAVLGRLTHGHSDRRAEALRAVRKLDLQSPDIPLVVQNELLLFAITAADASGHTARKMIKDQVKLSFFRDDNGQMLLRDRRRWWALTLLVLEAAATLDQDQLKRAITVKPDNPMGPFRLLLQLVFPPYSQHAHSDHLVQPLLALYAHAGGTCTILQRESSSSVAPSLATGLPLVEEKECAAISGAKQGPLRTLVILALAYATAPVDAPVLGLLAQAAQPRAHSADSPAGGRRGGPDGDPLAGGAAAAEPEVLQPQAKRKKLEAVAQEAGDAEAAPLVSHAAGKATDAQNMRDVLDTAEGEGGREREEGVGGEREAQAQVDEASGTTRESWDALEVDAATAALAWVRAYARRWCMTCRQCSEVCACPRCDGCFRHRSFCICQGGLCLRCNKPLGSCECMDSEESSDESTPEDEAFDSD